MPSSCRLCVESGVFDMVRQDWLEIECLTIEDLGLNSRIIVQAISVWTVASFKHGTHVLFMNVSFVDVKTPQRITIKPRTPVGKSPLRRSSWRPKRVP